MDNLITPLRHAYPQINFSVGSRFSWSAEAKTITYQQVAGASAAWSLLHEVGHAILRHLDFATDVELLLKEAAAWEVAQELGAKYAVEIPQNYIDDCVNSYRDWLNKRSACPYCSSQGLQADSKTYNCINCRKSWQVTQNRLCRPYRKK